MEIWEANGLTEEEFLEAVRYKKFTGECIYYSYVETRIKHENQKGMSLVDFKKAAISFHKSKKTIRKKRSYFKQPLKNYKQ